MNLDKTKPICLGVGHEACVKKFPKDPGWRHSECILGSRRNCTFCGKETGYWNEFIFDPRGMKKYFRGTVSRLEKELKKAKADLEYLEKEYP